MLRLPASRALSASSPLLSISSRLSSRGASLAPASRLCVAQKQQSRHQHAISNPTLANIEKRWEELPPAEQAELWMALRDRMKVDWHQLTLQEKRACTYDTCDSVSCFVNVTWQSSASLVQKFDIVTLVKTSNFPLRPPTSTSLFIACAIG